MVLCQASQTVPEIGEQVSCIINAYCALWKGKIKKSKKGYLTIPSIFDKSPTLSGSNTQII